MKNVLKTTSITVLRQQTLSSRTHWYSILRNERSTSICKFRTVPLEPKLLRILIHSHHNKDEHKIFPDEKAKRYVAPRCGSIANIWKCSFETTDATFPNTRPYIPQMSPTRQLSECSTQNRLPPQQAQIVYQDANTPNSYFKHHPLTIQCVQ
jgi:hypothetical protein